MPGDLNAIATAVYTALVNDAALRALAPDGVFWDMAPGKTRFVLMSHVDGDHVNALGNDDGIDRVTYLAKAVIASKSLADSNDAAFRIHELLHRGLQDVTAGAYMIMHIERVLPVRYTEIDPQNTESRWQHNGGQYQVWMCPTT